MVDLHRHDEFSLFDGFGKAEELAKLAKEKGYTALGISNHGNVHSFVKHYKACKNEGIKPILGCEGYFIPVYKEKARGYHLCLFAKNIQGYRNLNKIQTIGEERKYYNPIWDFDLLRKYHKGIICTTACIAGFLSQCIIKGRLETAEKFIKYMQSIFGDDFYIEIMPYRISENDIQEKVNVELLKLAVKMRAKPILTSDSHFGDEKDLDTYIKLHEIAGHGREGTEATYKERYMPDSTELVSRFMHMHFGDFKNLEKISNFMVKNLEELEAKVDGNIFENFKIGIPKFDDAQDSMELLKKKIKKGLKEKGKANNEDYINRVKQELKVIKYHNFADYFLIVSDYVDWSIKNNILIGVGRGSGCNCLINYLLGITKVDPIRFDLDFNRFLSIDKKKIPDIDIDFETSKRDLVVDYLLDKYRGCSSQICSYGLYKVDNLINDLAKICKLKDDEEKVKEIKKFLKSFIKDEKLNIDEVKKVEETKQYNKQYDNIIKHFCKLYKKVRYIGTHAAGVIISNGAITNYTALKHDAKTGKQITSYDLSDMEETKTIKFDILGSITTSGIAELKRLTGDGYREEWIQDENIIKEFRKGNCDGVFQFETVSAKNVLSQIKCDDFNDINAASAINRPAPLSLKMPEIYAKNKKDRSLIDKQSVFYEYLKETYNCVLYQEQVQKICMELGGFSYDEASTVTKIASFKDKGGQYGEIYRKEYKKYLDKFVSNIGRFGIGKQEATETFNKFLTYTFNKGHSTAYSLVSVQEMYYKVYHKVEFWYVKLKNEKDDIKISKIKQNIANSDIILFLPHVNYSDIKCSLRRIDGERIIQEGLTDLKGIGLKAALIIERERKENGVFRNFDNFYDRCRNRAITSKVIDILIEYGALEFNKKKYIDRIKKYNSALCMRAYS